MHSFPYKAFIRVRNAIGWRLRRVFGDHAVDAAMIACARRWRPLLKKPLFIGITGKCRQDHDQGTPAGDALAQGPGGWQRRFL